MFLWTFYRGAGFLTIYYNRRHCSICHLAQSVMFYAYEQFAFVNDNDNDNNKWWLDSQVCFSVVVWGSKSRYHLLIIGDRYRCDLVTSKNDLILVKGIVQTQGLRAVRECRACHAAVMTCTRGKSYVCIYDAVINNYYREHLYH